MSFKRPVRRSQVIAPFGVGAMLNFPGETLMVAGLDAWIDKEKYRITDQRLASRLNVMYFVQPPNPPDRSAGIKGNYLPTVRFPLWHQCPFCGTLEKVNWNDRTTKRCRSTIRFRESGPTCGELPEKRRPKLIPLRFVVGCAIGHLTDFPWLEWVHRQKDQALDNVEICENPKLRLRTTGRIGLEGIIVECHGCSLKKSLNGASGPNGLALKGLSCEGNRPWLGPEANETCSESPLLLQTAASNVYFSNVVSSILIPPYSSAMRVLIDTPTVWETLTSGLGEDGEPDPERIKIVAQMKRVEAGMLLDAVKEKLHGASAKSSRKDESSYRYAEYSALNCATGASEVFFSAKPQDISLYSSDVTNYIDKVVLVEKLAETRVLTGFSRVNPIPKSSEPSPRIQQLSRDSQRWLPAVRVFGEGIFFTLRDDVVRDWLRRPEVQERLNTLRARANDVSMEWHKEPRDIPSKFFALHTLAHLLIRSLSFECGYSAASIQERIYCSDSEENAMSGVLIFTAAGDAEGTLGGLIQMGKPENFDRLLRNALASAITCSSDPLCIESRGQGTDALNLAACYACCLLPETSCEEGNRLLDRVCLVGEPEDVDLGLFTDLSKQMI